MFDWIGKWTKGRKKPALSGIVRTEGIFLHMAWLQKELSALSVNVGPVEYSDTAAEWFSVQSRARVAKVN